MDGFEQSALSNPRVLELRRKAWHHEGIVCFRLDEIKNPILRRMAEDWIVSLHGPRERS